MTTAPQPVARPKRRWFQFSLRTLLVSTAVIGALLAVGLRWIAPVQRQRAVVRMVEQLGGTVKYAEWPTDDSFIVLVFRECLPRDYFDDVASVDLNLTKANDVTLANLKAISKLDRIDLEGTQVTNAGLVHLKGLKSLEWLYLSGTQVTDAGVAELRKTLPNCQIFH